MKKISILTVLLVMAISFSTIAEKPKKLTYYKNDSIKLELDLFMPDNKPEGKMPLLIYVHGGGFAAGDRKAGYALANYLAERGIVTATITYTLYMKGKSFSCDGILSEKVKAIQIAGNQLWAATNFMIKKSKKFDLDTAKFFIAGSSAGAETVLHAAFWDQQVMDLSDNKLPKNFKYAGVIAGAGAIMDLNLITESNKTPVMMFHGNADKLVPYATAAHHFCPANASGWLMLFGSQSIFQHLVELDETTCLITFDGGGHSYAGAHFYQEQEPVYTFISRVLAGEHFLDHKTLQSEYQRPKNK